MKPLTKYLAIILLFALGCSKQESFEPIVSDIEITMVETIDSTGRTFQLKCETKEHYHCANYQLVSKLNKVSNSYEIDFEGIDIPGVCLAAFGPALASIDFGSPENAVYDLVITTDETTSSGKLIVSEDYYILDFDKTERLEFINPILNRVPENTIWGTIGYHSPDTEPIVNSFIESLITIGVKDRSYLPGDYGYFIIDKDGNIEPPQMHGNYFIRPFIFEYSGESETVKEIVRDFGLNFDDKLKILLYTTEGDMFRSWAQ
jgi:hypothetical protein